MHGEVFQDLLRCGVGGYTPRMQDVLLLLLLLRGGPPLPALLLRGRGYNPRGSKRAMAAAAAAAAAARDDPYEAFSRHIGGHLSGVVLRAPPERDIFEVVPFRVWDVLKIGCFVYVLNSCVYLWIWGEFIRIFMDLGRVHSCI